jgi:hypothetical protein
MEIMENTYLVQKKFPDVLVHFTVIKLNVFHIRRYAKNRWKNQN